MTASTELLPSVRAAFAALIDYAGLFPPARLGIADAQREYASARGGAHAWMLGRFIVPAPTLIESQSSLQGPFSVIARFDERELNGASALRERGIAIEALEIPLEDGGEIDALGAAIAERGLSGIPAYVEIARATGRVSSLTDVMSRLSRSRLNAKLRCGGLEESAFPSVGEVAGFVAAARAAGVAFKATAGLHHPVRHVDRATGFTMHGFLNLLAAAALAPRADLSTLSAIVAEEDPRAFRFDDDSFAWRDRRIAVPELQATRREAFVAYGSCSFDEPVDDLAALALLPPR